MIGNGIKMKTRDLAIQAIIAATYVALSLALQPLTFYTVQIRFAELLLLLLLINPKHSFGIIIGCLITNLFSPLGMADVIFGTLATVITCYLMIKSKNDVVTLLIPAVVNGIIVGAELTWVFKELPFWMNAGSVFIGEFVSVFIIGMLIKDRLRKNKQFQTMFG